MALSILDGNQSATTLSTIITSGQHIPAHTIVSFGTQAKTDILSAVSSGITVDNILFNDPTIYIEGVTLSLPDYPNRTWSGYYKYNGNDRWGSYLKTEGDGNFIRRVYNNSYQAYDYELVVDGIDVDYVVYARVAQLYTFEFPLNWTNSQLGTVVSGSLIFTTEQRELYKTKITNSVTIGSIPNGALTTRFGSITTANTAFATTAVTNTSRKYLMIQNIASTVITAGIGFTPTTTQGIQLVAGATITYDGNYIPTGAVRILSSVTASNFTVLEA